MSDQIHIERFAVYSHIGVPDDERAEPQKLEISLTFPLTSAAQAAKTDDLALTVNYYQVCQTLKRVAAERPRKLIETLAEELCAAVLAEFPISSVVLEVRKFIISETKFISIKIERNA